MRLLKALVLATAALLGALADAGAQQAAVPFNRDRLVVAPRAEQTPEVADQTTNTGFVLNAQSGWADTGVTTGLGDEVSIVAEGRWAAVSSLRSANAVNIPYTGPDGYENTAGGDGLPLANANRGALIGRIGPNGPPFLIGSTWRGVADGEGPLQVSMNEPGQEFGDNVGRLSLRIARTPAPPPEETVPETPIEPRVEAQAPPVPVENNDAAAPETGTPAPASDDGGFRLPSPLVIGGAVVGGLLALWLIGSALFGARPGARARSGAQSEPPPGAIAARVISNGEAQETLTMTMRRAS